MAQTPEQVLARVHKVTEEVPRLGPMLVGTLMAKGNRKRRRDGSEYVSAP